VIVEMSGAAGGGGAEVTAKADSMLLVKTKIAAEPESEIAQLFRAAAARVQMVTTM
jgi:hypothetical protein